MNGPDPGIRILHVDDEPEVVDLAAKLLERIDDRFAVEMATSVEEGLETLSEQTFDCVVSDYDMPVQNGIEFLEAVRESHPNLPFILFTGKGSEEIASEAISAGVTDYLQKSSSTEQYAILANRIQNYIERRRAQEDRRRNLEAIETAQEGIAILDEDEHFAYVNQAFADIYDYEPEDLLDTHWKLVYPDGHVDRIRDDILPEVRETGYWHGETIGLRADGSTFVEDHTLATTDDEQLICTIRDVTDEKERERRIEAIFNNTHTFVGLLDTDGTLLEANDRALQFGGIGRDDVIGKPIWDTYWFRGDDEREQQVREAVEQARSGDLFRDEIVVRGSDGEAVIDFTVRPVTDEDDQVTSLIPEGRDITERKEYVRQIETLIDNVPGMVYRCRNERGWPMERVRGEVESLTGYRPSEIESRKDIYGEEIIHPKDRTRVWNEVQRAIADDEPFEMSYRILTADGTTKWVWERGRGLQTDGELASIEGLITDITERERAKQELGKANRVLRTVLENLPAGIIVEDTDRNVLLANKTVCDILDLPMDAEEMIGKDSAEATQVLKERFADPEEFISGIEETIDRREPVRGTDIELADGRSISRSYVPYTLPDGDANLWIYRDVTDQREREATLRRQNERLDDFASVVSHDLRNPLNVAQGRIALAQDACDTAHLDDAMEAIDRSLGLIESLLTLARGGTQVDEHETIDLSEQVPKCWATVRTADARLVDEADGTIRADRSRLKQLLENLIRNAIEHGGEDVTVEIGTSTNGVYVADDGPGIPQEERSNVFEPGYSTMNDGTGFGLSIVEDIADAHGWEVDLVESSAGGARFEITGIEFI